VKVGSNLIVDKDGALDINKYSIPAIGESQEIQTLYGKYLLTTNINSPYLQWKGSPASELSGADKIASSTKIKWTVDFNNTSFIIAVDGKPYKIEFGENDFDFSDKNSYLDWQIKIQEKIDQAIGEKIARVMIVSSGSHPITGGYGISILYAEELTDNYPFLQVFSAEENDTLTLINIASGSAIQLNLNKTIAEYMNTSAESFSYEANGISFSLNTNITLQEFFNIFNENSSSNIIIEYAKNKDAVLITSYTGSLEISDTIGVFDALGLGAGKTELVGHKYLVSLAQPDGIVLENIELKESEFTFDNNLALLQLLQQNSKGTIDYNELSNQPTLNGIPLAGDLSASDLGINDTNVYYGTEEPTTDNVTMWIDPSGTDGIDGDVLEQLNKNLQIAEKYTLTSTQDDILILNVALDSYEVGQIVRIQASKTLENPQININGLGVKAISGKVYANSYYNLVYDGTKFLLEQTRIGIDSANIVITTSGTYELNPELTYDVMAVGGGGGSAIGYYNDHSTNRAGGAGGKVYGKISNLSSITITIGAGGKNATVYDYSDVVTGTKGGNTTIGNMIAYGGGAATSGYQYDYAANGTGGSYSGGTSGVKGSDGISTADGGTWDTQANANYNGWNIDGSSGGKYGSGGRILFTWRDNVTVNEKGQDGVVVLTPVL
jgi:hypothetical protein